MEKNATRVGTVYQRLLRRLVKWIAVFCICAESVYGLQADDSIELRISGDECFIDREFEIDIFIKSDSPYVNRNHDTPRCILEHKNMSVRLTQSSAIPEFDGLHLHYGYRFTQTGRFFFSPILQWERQTVTLEPFSITVHQPPLSEHTEFLWKLYSADGDILSEGTALEQGQPYLLCLTAAFYSPGYADRYIRTAQSSYAARQDSRGEKERNGIHPDGGFPLPVEIAHIECPASENAVLRPLLPQDMPIPLETAVPLQNGAVLQPDTTASPSGDVVRSYDPEAYILAAFSWIPLQTGMQNLPEAHVFFSTGGISHNNRAAYRITPLTAAKTVEKAPSASYSHAAFTESLGESLESSSGITAQEEIDAAKKIAEYRKRELSHMFPHGARREREKLERVLNIVQPLPLYPYLFRNVAAVLTALPVIGAAFCLFRNKRRIALLLILCAICCGGVTAKLFHYALQPQGVCIAHSDNAAVRRIPETTGSIVHRLTPGESVIIVRKTAQWYYIKTVGGITGWIPQRSLLAASL